MNGWYIKIGDIIMPLQDSTGDSPLSLLVLVAFGALVIAAAVIYNMMVWFVKTTIEGITALFMGDFVSAAKKLAIWGVILLVVFLFGSGVFYSHGLSNYQDGMGASRFGFALTVTAIPVLVVVYLLLKHLKTLTKDPALLLVFVILLVVFGAGAFFLLAGF